MALQREKSKSVATIVEGYKVARSAGILGFSGLNVGTENIPALYEWRMG